MTLCTWVSQLLSCTVIRTDNLVEKTPNHPKALHVGRSSIKRFRSSFDEGASRNQLEMFTPPPGKCSTVWKETEDTRPLEGHSLQVSPAES